MKKNLSISNIQCRSNINIFLLCFCLSLILSGLVACSGSDLTASGATAAAATTNSDVMVAGSPLYIKVTSTPEKSTAGVDRGYCKIDTSIPIGGNSSCTITIPELDLYYSKLTFSVGTSSSTFCTYVGFQPYYFVKSNSATFKSDSSDPATTIDCSTGKLAACYGGAAREIASSFPTNTGVYFLSQAGLSMDYSMDAANTKRGTSGGDRNYQNNSYSTNDFPTASRDTDLIGGATGGVDYVGGTYRDYTVTCEDSWGAVLYDLTLTLTSSKTTPSGAQLFCLPSDRTCKYWHWNIP